MTTIAATGTVKVPEGSAEHCVESSSEACGWKDWGGRGPTVHLAHANGFPPGTYRQLINHLRCELHVVSSEARPLWSTEPPSSLASWEPLADDLQATIEQRSLRGCIGVGHSLGGVATLLASSRDPGIFRALVLIDPLVLTGWLGYAWKIAKCLGLGRQINLVKRAERRRARWLDRHEVQSTYRRKALFSTWAPGVLEDYLDAGLIEQDRATRLRYPPAWEARIFELSPHNLWPSICRLEVPTLFIRGAESDTLSSAAARRLSRSGRWVQVREISGAGHLVPMERPAELARVVIGFLNAHLSETSHRGPIPSSIRTSVETGQALGDNQASKLETA